MAEFPGLTGRRALVTAAGSGIGLAVVETLRASGARVVAVDLNVEQLREEDGLSALELDVVTHDAGQVAMNAVRAELGGLDVLVNGVGAQHVRPDGFLGTTDSEWRRTFELNVLSAIRMTRAALPLLQEAGGGSIVNIGSIAAREPSIAAPDYSVSKMALLGLTKSVAQEFGPDGIRCNIVAPGPTLTPVFSGWIAELAELNGRSFDEELHEFVTTRRRMDLQRAGRPEDVAAVVGFLASDISLQVTGSEYRVDGGALQSII